MNDLPQIENFDDALQRRFVIVQFKKKFRGDEIDLELKEGKLHNEMSGILQFALEGLKRLAEQKDFSCSQESKDMLDNYRLESNHAERFASLFLAKGEDGDAYLKVKDVYKKYIDYCSENGDKWFKQVDFRKIVQRSFGIPEGRKQKKINGNPEDIFEGLCYKTYSEDEESVRTSNMLDVLDQMTEDKKNNRGMYSSNKFKAIIKDKNDKDIEQIVNSL